jgi:hypothetical protein
MALLSVVAVFTAFFNRTAARACAGVAFGLAVLFLLLVLQMNHWDVGWLFVVAREVPYPFVILGGSLLLSAVAVLAPLRRPDEMRPDGGRVPGRPRWALLALAVCVTVVGTGYGIVQLIDDRRGEEKTRALLSGDFAGRLRRVQIDYQQRRVICTDPEVLRYLEDRFRGHEPEPDSLGTTYQLTLPYDGGGTQAFASYWTDVSGFGAKSRACC